MPHTPDDNLTHSVAKAIGEVRFPGANASLQSLDARIKVGGSDSRMAVGISVGVPVRQVERVLRARLDELLASRGLGLAHMELQQRITSHEVQPKLSPLPRIRNVIAVGSGKGGVGKSTVAINLALALAAGGARVGVLDADIYGPSVPMMLGLSGRPDSPDGKSIEPLRAHGVQAMSIGLLVEQDTPMIWRGPMATSALTQLLGDTRWGEGDEPLDYLIVDLPPGTGDIQLTLAQKIPVAGAVIVTTPQDIATLDAKKALKMFEKVEVPVLGLVENMAVHVCSNCGHAEHVFGEGGGARMAAQYGVPLLGSLPLQAGIREQGDAGVPIVAAQPDSGAAEAFRATALQLAIHLAQRPRATSSISASLV